jgi:hypothetical protein
LYGDENVELGIGVPTRLNANHTSESENSKVIRVKKTSCKFNPEQVTPPNAKVNPRVCVRTTIKLPKPVRRTHVGLNGLLGHVGYQITLDQDCSHTRKLYHKWDMKRSRRLVPQNDWLFALRSHYTIPKRNPLETEFLEVDHEPLEFAGRQTTDGTSAGDIHSEKKPVRRDRRWRATTRTKAKRSSE